MGKNKLICGISKKKNTAKYNVFQSQNDTVKTLLRIAVKLTTKSKLDMLFMGSWYTQLSDIGVAKHIETRS